MPSFLDSPPSIHKFQYEKRSRIGIGARIRLKKCLSALALMLPLTFAGAQSFFASKAPPANPAVRWFPIYARFAPDSSWLVVNLCSFHNPLYCRLVRWEPDGPPTLLEDGTPATGRWTLIEGQDPDKTYAWPSVSWSGEKLAYTVGRCINKRAVQSPPNPTGDPVLPPHPHERFECAFFDAQPAISDSVTDLRKGQQLAPVYSAARPGWRPDDQALIYWRTIATVTLASGRNLGVRDVYEYDFQNATETPKFDRQATKIRWRTESTSPFYLPDGKSFALCGYWDSLADPIQFPFPRTMFGCIEADTKDPRNYKAITRFGESGHFALAYAEWKGTHWLVERNSELVLHKRSSEAIGQSLLGVVRDNKENRNYSINGADIATNGDVVAISQTLTRQMIPTRTWLFEYHSISTDPPAPIFSLFHHDTKNVQAVSWPNFDALK